MSVVPFVYLLLSGNSFSASNLMTFTVNKLHVAEETLSAVARTTHPKKLEAKQTYTKCCLLCVRVVVAATVVISCMTCHKRMPVGFKFKNRVSLCHLIPLVCR